MRHGLAVTLVVVVVAAHGGWHSSATCDSSDPCPAVDQDPSSGEQRFIVQRGTLDVSVGDASNANEFMLTGGEIDIDPGDCMDAGPGCTAQLTRLRLELTGADLEVTTNIGTVHVVSPVVFLGAPVSVVRQGTGYLVGAGAQVHTCATIDGKAWHGVQTLANWFLIADSSIGASPSASLDATLPLALRADDESCTAFTLSGLVNAAAALAP